MSTSQHSSESYFYTPALKGLIQQLTHLAFFGDGISVVTGQKGSGKSALACELGEHLDQAHDVVSLSLHSDLELAECVEKISRALGVAQVDSLSVGEMLSELRAFVQTLSQENKLVVLVIDDAHHLDDQAVGALVSLLQGAPQSHAGLHLVLFSEPGLDGRIDALQIIDVAVYDFDLPNFSPTELSQFLSRDPAIEETLNSSLVQKIWVNAKGLPGAALALVNESGSAEGDSGTSKRNRFDFGVPYGHIAAIGVLALVLLWSLVGREGEVEEPPKAKVVAPGVVPGTVPADGAAESAEVAEEYTGSSSIAVSQSNEEDSDADVIEGTGLDGDEALFVQDSADEPALVDSEAALPSEEPLEVGDIAPADDENEMLSGDNEAEAMYEASSDAAVPLEVAAPSVNEVEEVIEPPSRHMNLSATMALTEPEVFLMAQNPDFYSLQVIAASKKPLLEAYMARQPNRDTLYMYRGTREGKSWYVVVQGVYSSREAAMKGLRMLPKEQSKAGPWPRKLSAIQEEIDEFRLK